MRKCEISNSCNMIDLCQYKVTVKQWEFFCSKNLFDVNNSRHSPYTLLYWECPAFSAYIVFWALISIYPADPVPWEQFIYFMDHTFIFQPPATSKSLNQIIRNSKFLGRIDRSPFECGLHGFRKMDIWFR